MQKNLQWILVVSLHVAYTLLPYRTRDGAARRHSLSLHQSRLLIIDPETIMDQEKINKLEYLVRERSDARYAAEYSKADALKIEIDAVELPDGLQVVIEDLPYHSGGGSTFRFSYRVDDIPLDGPGVLELAHTALGMSVSHADRNVVLPASNINEIGNQAKQILRRWLHADTYLRCVSERGDSCFSFERFCSLRQSSEIEIAAWSSVEEQLSGRKAADAAFWFALAGSADEELFRLLTHVCAKEVRRFGPRPSCQSKDLVAICDKLAAAGVKSSPELEEAMKACFDEKLGETETNDWIDPRKMLALHSESCTHMIWKFSSRQRKQKSFLSVAAKHWETQMGSNNQEHLTPVGIVTKRDWRSMYADATRPLVVDIGCGMGISMLGAATGSYDEDAQWCGCNFVGVDLSSLALRYACGVSTRWGLQDILQYVVDSAEKMLQDLQYYPGPIHTVLIQFPTPYRFVSADRAPDSGTHGNTQLPHSIEDGFMVTPALLGGILSLLADHRLNNECGKLVLQSNCEDVALWMFNTCCTLGFTSESAPECVSHPAGNVTQRTSRWIASGGARAVGSAWSSRPLLPRNAWTETEVTCEINKTPVHRCILRPGAMQMHSD